MKYICAWCGKFLGGDVNSAVISHGICQECSDKEIAKQEVA